MKRIICLILAAVMLIAVQTGFAADGGGFGHILSLAWRPSKQIDIR